MPSTDEAASCAGDRQSESKVSDISTAAGLSTAPKPASASPFIRRHTDANTKAETTEEQGSTAASADEEAGETEDVQSDAMRQHAHIDELTRGSAIFNTFASLYFWSQKTKSFETRGTGKLLIFPDPQGVFKLVFIRNQVMLRGCDHYISPTSPLTKANKVKNAWTWVAVNDQSEAEDKYPQTNYFVIFKTPEDSELFEKTYASCQDKNKARIEEIKKEAEHEATQPETQAESTDKDESHESK